MKLRSNSGNNIYLLHSKGKLLVRKIISNSNERDLLSFKKHINFLETRITKNTSACDIRLISKNPLTLDMDYIFGYVGEKIIRDIHPYNLKRFANNLNEYLISIFNTVKIQKIPITIFHNKLNQSISNSMDESINQVLNEIHIYINSIFTDSNYIEIHMGYCHGDLTFSNMIISENGQVCLIDFLETFCESPLQDYAKLIQELNYGWSFRNENGYFKTKAKIACGVIRNNLTIMEAVRIKWHRQCKLFELICLARIAPYATNNSVRKWLITSLNKALESSSLF